MAGRYGLTPSRHPNIPQLAISFEGRSGRTWYYDLARPRADPVKGLTYPGWSEDGEPVFVQTLSRSLRNEEIARAEHAHSIESEVASPFIVRTLDISDGHGEVRYVKELADNRTALTWPTPDPKAAAEVERNVGEALKAIHDHGFIHCDAAPNNVLNVSGVWKLTDLELCVPCGNPMPEQGPRKPYRHPDAEAGVPAVPEFDHWGLAQIGRRLRGDPDPVM